VTPAKPAALRLTKCEIDPEAERVIDFGVLPTSLYRLARRLARRSRSISTLCRLLVYVRPDDRYADDDGDDDHDDVGGDDNLLAAITKS